MPFAYKQTHTHMHDTHTETLTEITVLPWPVSQGFRRLGVCDGGGWERRGEARRVTPLSPLFLTSLKEWEEGDG